MTNAEIRKIRNADYMNQLSIIQKISDLLRAQLKQIEGCSGMDHEINDTFSVLTKLSLATDRVGKQIMSKPDIHFDN